MEFSDVFGQVDENPLSSAGAWTQSFGATDPLKLVSNRVRSVTNNVEASSTYTAAVPGNDQFVLIPLTTLTAGASPNTITAKLRVSTGATTYYAVDFNSGTTGLDIYKFIAGAFTDINFDSAVQWAQGDVALVCLRGFTFFVFKNNTLVKTFTDPGSSIASGNVGLAITTRNSDLAQAEVANWAAGDIRKTRFYLPNTGAAEISPAFTLGSSWTATTGADRIRMPVARISSTMTSKVQAAPGTAANQKWLFRQYVSDPIRGGGDIFGALFGQVRGLESAANDNIDAISLKLLVVDSAGSLRGTLLSLANYGTVAELNTSLRNKIIANGDGLTKVTYQNGDRIVAEIGLTNTTIGTSVSGTLSFGDDSGTDLAEDETATAANNPWLEFVGINLQLGRQPMTKPNLYALKRAAFH